MAAAAAALGLVRGLAVRLDERLGPTGYLVAVGEWVRSDDLPAFRLFGAQVAAALDSARDIAELSSRNVDLAALAELGSAGRHLGLARRVPAARPRGGRRHHRLPGRRRLRRLAGAPAAGADPRHRPGRAAAPASSSRATFESPLGAVVRQPPAGGGPPRRPRPGAARTGSRRLGLTTFVYVPLVARSQALGVMVVAWRERLDAGACRPELLLAMGSHLAAAMESHAPAPRPAPPRRRARGHPRPALCGAVGRRPARPSRCCGRPARAVASALSAPQVVVMLLDRRTATSLVAGRRRTARRCPRRRGAWSGGPLQAGGRGAAIRRARPGPRTPRSTRAAPCSGATTVPAAGHAGGAAGGAHQPRAACMLIADAPGHHFSEAELRPGLGAGRRAGAGAGERRALRRPAPGAGEEHPQVPPGGARRAVGGDRPRGPQPARRHLQLARLAAPPHRHRGRRPHAARHRRRGGRAAQPHRRRPARLRAPLAAAAGPRPAGAGGRRGGQRGGGPAAAGARGGPQAGRRPARA